MRGYLVVLAEPTEFLEGSKNINYRGIDRLPPYPSKFPEEGQAIEEYVFGEYKSEEGVIPSLEKAKELLALFRDSPRLYEIIYYETLDEAGLANKSGKGEFLGFDVALSKGDRWSILADFPEHPAMDRWASRVNDHGLFDSVDLAEGFLSDYRRLGLPDCDMNLQVL